MKQTTQTAGKNGFFTLIELLANTARFTGDSAQFIKVGEMREER